MRRLTLVTSFAAILGCAAAPSARAESLVVSLSNHRVAVTSNFVGADLVLFGTIEPTGTAPLRSNYDIHVTVTGPRATLRTRRKERVLGVWVNIEARQFIRVPSYLSILSNKPVTEITNSTIRRELQLDLNNVILTQRVGPDFADTVPDDPFRVNFIKLEKEAGRYREVSNGVTFLTPTVFRVGIPLPADVPTGAYAVDVKLFADGQMLSRTNTALEVVKTGFEQHVYEASQHHGLIYGIVAAMMALFIGWAGSVVFRRD